MRRRLPLETLGSLALSVILAFTIWVAAVNDSDPVLERSFASPLTISYVGVEEGLQPVGTIPGEARLTLRAPTSVWEELSAEDFKLTVDLAGLAAGEHRLPIVATTARAPIRIIEIQPAEVSLRLEAASTQTVPVVVEALGELALGYRTSSLQSAPASVEVEGPTSMVQQVVGALAEIDQSGRRQDFDSNVELIAIDSQRQAVEGVRLTPASARVAARVSQLGGYRLVAVIPIIEGDPDPGYQITEIGVTPTLVTVFSATPDAVENLPGFVETDPVDLQGLTGPVEKRVGISVPADVILVGDQTVLVRVGIAPIEITSTLTHELAIEGLRPGLFAGSSPEFVSVILKGPLPTLESIQPEDLLISVDVTGLGPGTHQLTPVVVSLPENVIVQSIVPDSVEIVISTTPIRKSTPAP
ncbi:MAG: CdaR family protein [Anaerolineales bacterium]|nr:CdaR family protein [Anaerolineales bacterium]